MSNPLTQAGALGPQSKYAPLHTNRFFTGLWTQRNPLRDAATSYLQEKFYGGSRFDSLIDGLNTEITTRLTPARRPGHSVYNAQVFPAIRRFYEFRIFSTTTEIVKIMADCDGVVYDATGPNTKASLFNKAAGAADTSFQSVGNTLYMGDGAETKKWVQSGKAWAPNAQFAQGDFIVDPNGNLQVAIGATSAQIVSVRAAHWSGPDAQIVVTFQGKIPNSWGSGMRLTFAGLQNAGFLNGATFLVLGTAYRNAVWLSAPGAADYNETADVGTGATAGGVTGGVAPAWSGAISNVTVDGQQQWICKGPALQNWGIVGPSQAPSVANARRPAPYPAWLPNTYYSPSLTILDANGNVQQLTTGGVLGGGAPAWNLVTGGTTADGTAVWTNRGPGAWQPSHAYAVGNYLQVTWDYWVSVWDPTVGAFAALGSFTQTDGGARTGEWVNHSVSVTAAFRCIQAGVTGAATPAWQDGIGSTVADGGVIWQNVGPGQTWASIGAGTSVSLTPTVIDANGNKQQIFMPGKSGAAAPAWNATLGRSTSDNTAVWQCGGPYSGAQTLAWIYAYAFANSVTGEVSTLSPVTQPITEAASSLITLQGQGSADPQVDIVQVYRTALNGSTLLLLDEFLNPGAVPWSYQDAADDSALAFTVIGVLNQSFGNNPPPTGIGALAYHLRRVWGAAANTVFFSGGPDTINGNGNSAFPPANSFVFPSKVVRLMPTTLSGIASSQSASALLVFTVSDIYIILGQGTANSPFYPILFRAGIGLLNYDALTMYAGRIYLLTSARKLIELDVSSGGDPLEVGFPIGDQFEALYDPSAAHVTWHEGSSKDSALYVADGTSGWFRMITLKEPESGIVWAPRAQLAAGCRAVASLEVQPGVAKLLVGPGVGGGPILQRDTTVNTDNAVPFPAFATVGSIVMAQGGQHADIEFLTLDSIRAGKRPEVAILLNEISGPFKTVQRTRQDMPLLPPSKTLYSDRYVFQQDQTATLCRHFQWRITWAAEDAHNELLSYTIFGALHQEKHQ